VTAEPASSGTWLESAAWPQKTTQFACRELACIRLGRWVAEQLAEKGAVPDSGGTGVTLHVVASGEGLASVKDEFTESFRAGVRELLPRLDASACTVVWEKSNAIPATRPTGERTAREPDAELDLRERDLGPSEKQLVAALRTATSGGNFERSVALIHQDKSWVLGRFDGLSEPGPYVVGRSSVQERPHMVAFEADEDAIQQLVAVMKEQVAGRASDLPSAWLGENLERKGRSLVRGRTAVVDHAVQPIELDGGREQWLAATLVNAEPQYIQRWAMETLAETHVQAARMLWLRRGVSVVALVGMVALGYVFLTAGGRARHAWLVRGVTAAAFVALCAVAWAFTQKLGL
jgi:hypothetical protein